MDILSKYVAAKTVELNSTKMSVFWPKKPEIICELWDSA